LRDLLQRTTTADSRRAGEALTALQADNPGPAQQAVAEMVDLACETSTYGYFHSDDPVDAAKFVVSDAVAALWESVLRHDGFAAFTRRVPGQLIRWEAEYPARRPPPPSPGW
jgi:hypothetical protein